MWIKCRIMHINSFFSMLLKICLIGKFQSNSYCNVILIINLYIFQYNYLYCSLHQSYYSVGTHIHLYSGNCIFACMQRADLTEQRDALKEEVNCFFADVSKLSSIVVPHCLENSAFIILNVHPPALLT